MAASVRKETRDRGPAVAPPWLHLGERGSLRVPQRRGRLDHRKSVAGSRCGRLLLGDCRSRAAFARPSISGKRGKVVRRHGGDPRLTWRPRLRLSLPRGEAAVWRRRSRWRSLVVRSEHVVGRRGGCRNASRSRSLEAGREFSAPLADLQLSRPSPGRAPACSHCASHACDWRIGVLAKPAARRARLASTRIRNSASVTSGGIDGRAVPQRLPLLKFAR
jgi:hypothetical protein